MDKNKEYIAQESLRFLSDKAELGEFPCKISSLPFPKEVMIDAIRELVASSIKTSSLSKKDLDGIKIYYSSLANFIDDEQTEFVTKVNEELDKIGPRDTEAAEEWLKVPANDEKEKKVVEIMAQSGKERDLLRQEFDALIS